MSKNILVILLLIFLDIVLNVMVPMTLVWVALNGYLPFELVDYYWLGLGIRAFVQGLKSINLNEALKGDK